MNTTNDYKEKLVQQSVKIASVEKPGIDFTSSVMNKIEGLQPMVAEPIKSTPLISWKGWLIICVIAGILFSLLFLSGPTTINIDFIDSYFESFKPITFSFPALPVSKIFIMGLCAFIVFFIIEISLISKRLKKA